MGEGQPRHSTQYSDEYLYKYRDPLIVKPGLFVGDDRDVMLKSWKGLQYGAVIAHCWMVILNQHCVSPAPAVVAFTIADESKFWTNLHYKTFKYGLPVVIAGGAYGLTVGLVSRLRDKSDIWNHICAGVVSGQIFGGWHKSVSLGRWCSLGFAATGFVIKALSDNNALYTTPRFGDGPFNSYQLSFFTKRPPQEGVKDA